MIIHYDLRLLRDQLHYQRLKTAILYRIVIHRSEIIAESNDSLYSEAANRSLFDLTASCKYIRRYIYIYNTMSILNGIVLFTLC